MIRSMTGYGQGSNEAGSVRFQVEARSVNHRFLDLRLRLPSGYQCCEKDARALVRSRIRRGRVEVSVSLDRGEEAGPGLQVDHPLVRSVLNASQDLKARYGLSGELDVATVLRLPGVLREESSTSGPQKAEKEALLQAVDRAAAALEQDRVREGESLRQEMSSRLDRMARTVEEIAGIAGRVPEEGRKKLIARLEQLSDGLELDPARLTQEAAILADRSDVTEEIVRLRSHIAQASGLLAEPDGEPVGKRLDFLLQEINRETNTINSKASDLEISRRALVMKVEGEKVREQLQNLE